MPCLPVMGNVSNADASGSRPTFGANLGSYSNYPTDRPATSHSHSAQLCKICRRLRKRHALPQL